MASAHAKQKANAMRKDIIEMIHEAGSGHPGGRSRAPIFWRRSILAML